MAQQKRRRRRVNESVAKTTRARSQKKTVTETKQVRSTDKFQRMLEYLVNEDQAKAEDLFHQIVVEKSRQIYENLLAEEDEEEEKENKKKQEESMYEDDDEDVEESDDEDVDESDEELDEYDTTSYQDANDDDQDQQSGHEGTTPGGVDYIWTGGQGNNRIQFGEHGTQVNLPTEDGEFGEANAKNQEVAGIFSQHLAGVGADDDAIEAIEAAIDEVDQTVDMAGDEEDYDEGYYDEAEDDLEMGGDPEGDLSMDMDDEGGDDDMDAGEGGEVTQDQIADLEAELADLKAEFEELMADEGGDDAGDDMDMGGDEGDDDMDMGDEEGGEDDMEEPAEEESFHMEARRNQPKSAAEQMREYVEKIAGPNFPGPGKMGDNGVQTKSPVASKNDMGGTTANIVNTGTTNATTVAAKGQLQGAQMQSPVPKVDDMGNVNKPGAKAAKNFYKPNSKGYGAEKTGAMSKETEADKSAGSPLNGAPKRAK